MSGARLAPAARETIARAIAEAGGREVAFRVAMKDGKVNFTVRGLKGEGK